MGFILESQETRVLLSLLAHELFGRELDPREARGADWDRMMNEADQHVVTALLYPGLSRMKGVPEDILDRARGAAAGSVVLWESSMDVQREAIDALEEKDIPYAILKGTSEACFYPHPELRISGDIDLLVYPKQLDEACSQLKQAGYCEKYMSKILIGMVRKDSVLEVHRMAATFPDTDKGRYTQSLMINAIQHSKRCRIGTSEFAMLTGIYQFVSLLAHLERHMMHAGISLRQVCDWAVTVNAMRDQADDGVIAVLRSCGLLKFAQVMTRICERYLAMPAVPWSHEVPKELVDSAMADVISMGKYCQSRKGGCIQTMIRRSAPPWPTGGKGQGRTEASCPWIPGKARQALFRIAYPVQKLLCKRMPGGKKTKVVRTIQRIRTREQLMNEMKLFQ